MMPKTREEALKKMAGVARADLLGCSEPPHDHPDNYPFNALAWVKALPAEWQEDAHNVVVGIYHSE